MIERDQHDDEYQDQNGNQNDQDSGLMGTIFDANEITLSTEQVLSW